MYVSCNSMNKAMTYIIPRLNEINGIVAACSGSTMPFEQAFAIARFYYDFQDTNALIADADCRYTYRMPEQENIWEYFKVLLQRLRLYVDNPFMAGPDGFSPEDNSQLYCLREGLVNLLAHADYFSPMHSTIRVFNDRIEFQNPGRFAVRISDKPGKVKSVPRNPNIIAFFRYARQGENAGYGIDKIMRWTKLTGLEVDFDSDITSSTVTYPLPLVKGGQNEVVRTSGQNQGDETRSKIVEAMRKKPEISRRELAETVGISQSAIQKHIEHLKGAGIIIRLGSDRKGLWKVLK